jgi:hypothetical protein
VIQNLIFISQKEKSPTTNQYISKIFPIRNSSTFFSSASYEEESLDIFCLIRRQHLVLKTVHRDFELQVAALEQPITSGLQKVKRGCD